MADSPILALAAFFLLALVAAEDGSRVEDCLIYPQKNLDLDQALGKWYAVEIIYHRRDTKQPKGVTSISACPIVKLSKMSGNEMRLEWQEDAGALEYKFFVADDTTWLSTGAQNGSLLQMTYTQFAGKLYVTKAVASHMVLTLCTPSSELVSFVVSRDRKLPYIEIKGVNKMLDHRGLERVAVTEACKGSAFINTPSLSLALVFISLRWIFS